MFQFLQKTFVFCGKMCYIHNVFPDGSFIRTLFVSMRNERGRRVAVLDWHLPCKTEAFLSILSTKSKERVLFCLTRISRRHLHRSFAVIPSLTGLGVRHLRERKTSTPVVRCSSFDSKASAHLFGALFARFVFG